MEETVSGDEHGDLLAACHQADGSHRARGCAPPPGRSAESREVVLAAEGTHGVPHPRRVEGKARMPGEATAHGVRDAAAIDQVQVTLAERAPPRIEAGGSGRRLEDAHALREERGATAREPGRR